MIGAQKTNTIFDDLQDATAEDQSIAFGFRAQQPKNEIGFLEARITANCLFFSDFPQFGEGLAF
jgi:hypothetical protein